MTDQEPAAGNTGRERGTASNACGQPGLCQRPEVPPDKGNKHVVHILGTYSLLTFFEEKGQRAFFETITGEEFETTFKPQEPYARCIEPFHFDTGEKAFELRMTNMGFIREGFWKEAFPPIFQLKDDPKEQQTWKHMLPECTKEKLTGAIQDQKPDTHAEAHFYRYCLTHLANELGKVGGQHEIHIGLNRFGIVNIGITIKWDRVEDQCFEDLCKEAYKNVSHLQVDPLEDFKCGKKLTVAEKAVQDQVLIALTKGNSPRLVVPSTKCWRLPPSTGFFMTS